MSDGCVSYPGSRAVAPVPAQVISKADYGWDAGANSVDRIAGGLHVVFTMPNPVIGAVNGLRSARAGVGIPDLVEFGFLFLKTVSGGDKWAVIENGVVVGGYTTRPGALDETFEVRRVGSVITYRVNNVLVHTSAQKTFAPLLNTGCLFASGDSIA